jgi:NADH-quinone oxidoreductase subunit J
MEAVLFYVFAVLIVGSALVVVTSKNIMYSAFALLFTFFGVAAVYVLLSSDFVALTQIMVYIGGVLVLIIFGVMLTTKITGVDIKTGIVGKSQNIIAIVLCLILAAILYYIIKSTTWISGTLETPKSTIAPIGYSLMTDYLLMFEVASVLLLIALVGAALIARRK